MPRAKKRPPFAPATSSPASEPGATTGWVYRSDPSPAGPAVSSEPRTVEDPPRALPSGRPPGVERRARAYEVVSFYSKWSAAAGLIPVPLLDVAAVTGLQLAMISDLALLYDVPFSRERAKATVGALVGSVTPRLLGSALKAIPGLGTAIGVLATPAFNAASTLALGRVFVQHFESGGTGLDMDPDTLREPYGAELESARPGER